ncbi:delta-class carbonic anhydrase [Jiella avicenniae]|uniref:Cadmium carbonic anhydrase n=1 Tax=Jiella avicenniae TaxID=2907202 RepID=A0A9X1T4L5_9HYPH|nr:cadmium carbonic anhydrase [Jiella avicenniae]
MPFAAASDARHETASAEGDAKGGICTGFGPQSPRDVGAFEGLNARVFARAPAADSLNLCNLHLHANAEHKASGFSISAGGGEHGGYKCNDSDRLSADELEDPAHGFGPFKGVKPGDTIEVHWVFSSCDVGPGEGLGSCLSKSCSNPALRVEAQTFLVVNDPAALDFESFASHSKEGAGYHQPPALPQGTGTPVVYLGSTTGPKYDQATCSPLQVTWSVRPQCARLDISSLHRWAEKDNVFHESHAHGVRQLVTDPQLLSPIERAVAVTRWDQPLSVE